MLEWRGERAGSGPGHRNWERRGNSGMSLRGGLIMRFRHYSDRARILPRGCFSQQLWCWGRSTLLAIGLRLPRTTRRRGSTSWLRSLAAPPIAERQRHSGPSHVRGQSAAIGPVVGSPLHDCLSRQHRDRSGERPVADVLRGVQVGERAFPGNGNQRRRRSLDQTAIEHYRHDLHQGSS